jgi:hypothetical protein
VSSARCRRTRAHNTFVLVSVVEYATAVQLAVRDLLATFAIAR